MKWFSQIMGKTRRAGKKLKRKKCETTEDLLSTNPNKTEKVTWNYLLQGHCPLPYVRNKFKKHNTSGTGFIPILRLKIWSKLTQMQYHQFLIIEFQPNRTHNIKVIIASQVKHIHHKNKGITNFNHYSNGSDRQNYWQPLLLQLDVLKCYYSLLNTS